MNKYKETFGVDISKDVIDVHGSVSGHNQFSNALDGFKSFLKTFPNESLVVMEAAGYYHCRLAQFLCKKKVAVSVVNPLSVKHFLRMKLSKIKTDKSDSKPICECARQVELKLWQVNSKHQIEFLQMTRLFSVYTKQSTMLKNKLQGETVLGNPSKLVVGSLKRSLKHVQKEIKTLEEKLLILVKQCIKMF
jgi:transposase